MKRLILAALAFVALGAAKAEAKTSYFNCPWIFSGEQMIMVEENWVRSDKIYDVSSGDKRKLPSVTDGDFIRWWYDEKSKKEHSDSPTSWFNTATGYNEYGKCTELKR